MNQNRSIYCNVIFKAVLLLIFGVFIISMFSFSYGYWTEKLEVKGDATIRMRLLIQNDIDIDAEMNAVNGETDLPQEIERDGVSELP